MNERDFLAIIHDKDDEVPQNMRVKAISRITGA